MDDYYDTLFGRMIIAFAYVLGLLTVPFLKWLE